MLDILRENFLSLYCMSRAVQVGIDHCRGYPAFQEYAISVERVSLVVDMFFFAYLFVEIPQAAKRKYYELNCEYLSQTRLDTLTFVHLGVGGSLSYLAMRSTNSLLNGDTSHLLENISPTYRDKVQLNWDRPFFDKFAQCIQMAQVINTLIFAYLENQKFYGLIALSHLYSFYTISKVSWLKMEVELSAIENIDALSGDQQAIEALRRVDHFIFTYHLLMMSSIAERGDECSVCLDEKSDTHFCLYHTFHDKCLVGIINATSQSILNEMTITTKFSEGGTLKSIHITVPEENLPSCPMCRRPPIHSSHRVQAVLA